MDGTPVFSTLSQILHTFIKLQEPGKESEIQWFPDHVVPSLSFYIRSSLRISRDIKLIFNPPDTPLYAQHSSTRTSTTSPHPPSFPPYDHLYPHIPAELIAKKRTLQFNASHHEIASDITWYDFPPAFVYLLLPLSEIGCLPFRVKKKSISFRKNLHSISVLISSQLVYTSLNPIIIDSSLPDWPVNISTRWVRAERRFSPRLTIKPCTENWRHFLYKNFRIMELFPSQESLPWRDLNWSAEFVCCQSCLFLRRKTCENHVVHLSLSSWGGREVKGKRENQWDATSWNFFYLKPFILNIIVNSRRRRNVEEEEIPLVWEDVWNKIFIISRWSAAAKAAA